MNHLLRQIAPITDSGWARLDEEATQRLGVSLAARKLVDFAGPYGWQYSASNLGRVRALAEGPSEAVTACQRTVLPLVELRAPFSLSRGELEDADRGAPDLDLGSLDEAARRIAVAENTAVFHGYEAAGIRGIAERSPQPRIPLGEDCESYPRLVAMAIQSLRNAGIGGPYGLALAPGPYTGVIETAEHGGYLLLEHLHHILEGPTVWAPGVRGAVAVSLRGGDFLFESGQDLAIGYDHHDAQAVALYLEESFALRIATPEAAVWLSDTG
jgi:uncharacterized linocin/CFP29 family protein